MATVETHPDGQLAIPDFDYAMANVSPPTLEESIARIQQEAADYINARHDHLLEVNDRLYRRTIDRLEDKAHEWFDAINELDPRYQGMKQLGSLVSGRSFEGLRLVEDDMRIIKVLKSLPPAPSKD